MMVLKGAQAFVDLWADEDRVPSYEVLVRRDSIAFPYIFDAHFDNFWDEVPSN